MALSLRENRKKKNISTNLTLTSTAEIILFEVGDVNFQMLKWLPNILLTLHKLCIGVVYHHLPPLPCMCVCMQCVFTSLISQHAVFLSWLQCFSHCNDTMLEMISFLTAHKSRETHCHATLMHISIWSHCIGNEQHPLSNMIISFAFYVLPFFCGITAKTELPLTSMLQLLFGLNVFCVLLSVVLHGSPHRKSTCYYERICAIWNVFMWLCVCLKERESECGREKERDL